MLLLPEEEEEEEEEEVPEEASSLAELYSAICRSSNKRNNR